MTPSMSPEIGARASVARPQGNLGPPTLSIPGTPVTSTSVVQHPSGIDGDHFANGTGDLAISQLDSQPNPFSEEQTAGPRHSVSKQIQNFVDSVETVSREQIQYWQKEEAKAIRTHKYNALYQYLPEYLFAKAPGMPKHKDEDQMRNVPSLLDQEVSRAKSQAELFTYLSHIPNFKNQVDFMSRYMQIQNTGNELSTSLMRKRRDQLREAAANEQVWDKEKTKKDPKTGKESIVHKQGDKKNLDHEQDPLPKGKLAESQAQEIRRLQEKVASLEATLELKNQRMQSVSVSLQAAAGSES